ncbi:MAG: sigma-70 family RNA polymerase sigma factor [Candidatus Micrarchaeota archaeon]|nr:sigma-70 family RNA polymerase sigma factor [Candidatus Micrarchaeota archaeon]
MYRILRDERSAAQVEKPKYPIRYFFQNTRYANARELLTHVEQMSREIQERKAARPKKPRAIPVHLPPSKPRELTAFEKLVAQIAPNHRTYRGKQYDARAIASEILKRTQPSAEPKKFSRGDLQKINWLIKKLVNAGAIPRTSVITREIIREKVPDTEVKQHEELIRKALRFRRYGMGLWWKHLGREEAKNIGREALIKALRTHNPEKKASFKTYAINVISGAISDEVRKRREKQLKATVSLDAPQRLNTKMLEHERIGTATPNLNAESMDKLQALLDLHKNRQVPASDPALYALSHIYGHSAYEIAPVIGSSRHAIELLQKRIEKRAQKAMKKIESAQREAA